MIFRKGMGAKAVVSIILAVIGVIFIGMLAINLYNQFVDNENKNAQAFIDDLNGKIELLENGQNNTFALRGVEGWVLVAWNQNDSLSEKPQKCFDKNCLCICQGSSDNCQNVGYCRFPDKSMNVATNFSVYINKFNDGSKDYLGNAFSKCIAMEKSLLSPFRVTKNEVFVSISLEEDLHDSRLYNSPIISKDNMAKIGCEYTYSGFLNELINQKSDLPDIKK